MMAHPPMAEGELKDKKEGSYANACRNAKIAKHAQPPIVENHGANHALCQIVRQTHPPIRSKKHQAFATLDFIVDINDARHPYQSEGKLV